MPSAVEQSRLNLKGQRNRVPSHHQHLQSVESRAMRGVWNADTIVGQAMVVPVPEVLADTW